MQRRRHEDDAHLRVPRQQLAQQDQQEIGEAVPLVDLVADDVRDASEPAAVGNLPQQHAVGAEHQRGVVGADGLEADRIPDAFSALPFAALLRHALGDGDGGDAAGLGADDAGAARGAALLALATLPGVVEEVLRDLSVFFFFLG